MHWALFIMIASMLSSCFGSYENKDSALFANVITHYYYGQNLELLNSAQPFDSYSLFQYIFDIGGKFEQEIIAGSDQSASLSAQLRMKGLLGDAGSCLPITNKPVKIGWTKTETVSPTKLDAFLIWMREAALTYLPTQYTNNFFKIGLFPFKIGNGFVLGNAYKINIPISWQFIYEQIDQFRPGVMLSATNAKETVQGIAYLGILTAQSTRFEQNAAATNIQNLETPYPETGSGKGNIVTVLQCNITPALKNNNKLLVSPFLFLQKSNDTVEFFNDATTTLITPGIYGTFERDGIRISFEGGKNCGHQHVKKWDRNQLIQASILFNNHLFYVPDRTIPFNAVTDDDFTFSPLVIRPESIAQSYGNGTNFLYAPDGTNTFVFKNSYDRLRNGYNNRYDGYYAYLDFLFTAKRVSWGAAVAYTSGGNNPNDSYDTIMMTRLTPDISYQDYSKNYKGFTGVNQLFEGKSINPLYFAVSDFRYTNLFFVGTTVRYEALENSRHLKAQGTIVTYVKPAAVTKGLSATLWQEQSLDFTAQMRTDMTQKLPRYLGTECNFEIDYTLGDDLTFSLLGGIFFPGSYFKERAGKALPLQEQAQLNQPNFTADQGLAITFGKSPSYFISLALTCFFDIENCKNMFKRTKSLGSAEPL